MLRWRFIDIPRTGSTAFRNRFGAGSVHGQAHMPASVHAFADKLITIVREPLDRAISLCAWVKRAQLLHEERDLTPGEFTRWVEQGLRYNGATVGGTPHAPHVIVSRTEGLNWLCLPQTVWLFGRNDVGILKYDDLSQPAIVAAFIKHHLHRTTDGIIPRQNEGRRGPVTNYENADTVGVISRLYATDYELLESLATETTSN